MPRRATHGDVTSHRAESGEVERTPPRRVALPEPALGRSPLAGLDREEVRAFLQQRLALFSKTAFIISSFFLVAGHVIFSTTTEHSVGACWGRHLWHAAGSALSLAIWLATRRGRWTLWALVVLDAAGVLLSLTAYTVSVSLGELPADTARVDMAMMLATLTVLVLRAVLVPSTTLHTLLVSTAGTAPVLGVTWLHGAAVNLAVPHTAYIALWCVTAVTVAAVTSRALYGLRAQVAEARRLGQYTLDEKIGEGGMGAVYRARHALLRRPTAIKLVLPEKAGGQSLLRFEREVQLTAMLTHPNTVSVFDFGRTPDGIFYYAMEYLDGVNLEELVEHFGPQEPARVVHILAQICGSLAEAHGAGLVHRDIKPGNVILCERGGMLDTVKVVDFGLVKDVGASGGDHPGLSTVNSVVGTPLYLAPEALLSPETLDARADLYAVGAVGYFLLTGTPPFSGASVMEICAQHLHAAPAPPSARLGKPVAPDLERVLLACLAKRNVDRPSDASALRDALLACDVPAWTPADAQRWWRAHDQRISGFRAERRAAESTGVSTVAVDLGARCC